MKTHKIIMIDGYTDKCTATLWGGSKIETHTSFNVEDFDFGDDVEKELQNCKNYIQKMEQTENWIIGFVTCRIEEFEIED